MKIKDIVNSLQQWAPLDYQESYDNSGLILGEPSWELKGILISLDVTEEVIDEAIKTSSNMIVAHHPLIFKGLKQINSDHWVNRCIIKAIKNDIAIYAIHTNLDNIQTGVNQKLAEKIGLKNPKILEPKTDVLRKLVTFIPSDLVQDVMDALFHSGAGKIGNYDRCSYQIDGIGTFRPNEKANPAIGEALKDEMVNEKRVEIIYPKPLESRLLSTLIEAHPYEEVAYYLQPLFNKHQEIGSGMIGELDEALAPFDFLNHLQNSLQLKTIRYTKTNRDKIKKVAICGGSGSFLLNKAMRQEADAFVTGDFKYHDFFEGDRKILIADIGHYESEAATKDLLLDFLREKFTNIAVRLTEVNTNPINYL